VDPETFARVCEEVAEELPPELFEELNGGIIISDRARRHPGGPRGVYVLGEYHRDWNLGCHIVMYHGSFARLYHDLGAAAWRRRIRATLVHELRHHIENRAGVRDLEREDERQLARMWRRTLARRRRPRGAT